MREMQQTMNEHIRREINWMSYRYGDISDEDLIAELLFRRGCKDVVFYLLYGRYFHYFENICRHIGAKPEWLPDLLAELEVHLLDNDCKALRSFKGEASLKTWLITVARNLFINRLPQIASLYSDKPQLDDRTMPEAIVAVNDVETLTSFRQALSQLPSVEQRIVLMKEAEGYNAAEIAAMLTERRNKENKSARQKSTVVSVDNVYKIRQRAVVALKQLLVEERRRNSEEFRFRTDGDDLMSEPTMEFRYKTFVIENIIKIDNDVEAVRV